jgi:hypothetical protein
MQESTATVWERLAAPLPLDAIEWRQQGKPSNRDGRYFAIFVAYVEAGIVRQRLDEVVPGAWSLDVMPLPKYEVIGKDGKIEPDDPDAAFSFKATLTIHTPLASTAAVSRSDVGVGKDWKQASTDAFKRVAVRFGIGNELYSMDKLWLEVDGDGKYAKSIEDPKAAWARKSGAAAPGPKRDYSTPMAETPRGTAAPAAAPASAPANAATCPKCQKGGMWDNRAENVARRNRGEKERPDFRCRDRACDGVIWPPKDAAQSDAFDQTETGGPPEPATSTRRAAPAQVDPLVHRGGTSTATSTRRPAALQDDDDDLPF